jgi:putative ABC transport system permease protein
MWFAILFTAALAVLLALAALALWILRFLLNRVRLRLPGFLRHGLANLYRPGINLQQCWLRSAQA